LQIINKVPAALIRYSNSPGGFIDTSYTSPDTSVDKVQDPYSYFRNIFIQRTIAKPHQWCRNVQ